MKRFITLLFLLIIYGNVFSQDIESHLKNIEAHVDSIRLLTHSDPVAVPDTEPDPYPEPIPDADPSVEILYGYWDHWYGPDHGEAFLVHVNVGKALSSSIGKIVDQGIFGIPIIEGFNARDSREVWHDRLEDKARQIMPYASKVPFVILIDEPYSRGWTDEKLEWLIEEARVAMPGLKFAYTVKQLSTSLRQRPDRRLPQNADFIGINYYPFRIGGGVDTQAEFNAELTLILEDARIKLPEQTQLFLVGQAFYENDKWHEPPVDSPLWYADVVKKERLSALIWYEWRDRSRVGTRSMPWLYEKQIEAGKMLIINE